MIKFRRSLSVVDEKGVTKELKSTKVQTPKGMKQIGSITLQIDIAFIIQRVRCRDGFV